MSNIINERVDITHAKTEFEHFTVITRPCEAPEGRDWGARHWRFMVVAGESVAMHRGIFSAGEAVRWSNDAEFHAVLLEALGSDASIALEGGGDMVSQLEALDAEGVGYGLVEGYRVAVELVRLYEFVSALTEAEFAALTGDCEDNEREVTPNVERVVAEELRAAREEAWYDGYSAGGHDEAFGGTESNPHCLEGKS